MSKKEMQDRYVGSPAMAWLTLISGMILYVAVNFLRSAIPGPVFDQLQAATGGTAAQIAALGATYMYSYAAVQMVTGLLIDHYGSIRVIRVGGLIMALSALLQPFCKSIPTLYACRIACGLGSGTIYLGIVKGAILFPRRLFGIVIGMLVTTGFAGGVLATAPFTAAVEHFGVHAMLMAIGIATCVIYVLWFLGTAWVPQTDDCNKSLSLKPFAEVMRVPQNLHVFFFGALNYAPFCVMQTVLGKKFLQDYCEMESMNAAMVFTATSVILALTGIAVTTICRVIGNRYAVCCRIAAANNLFLFSLFCILIFFKWTGWVFPVGVCLLASTSLMTTVTVPVLRIHNPDSRLGVATSVMNFNSYIFVALLGNLSGVLMDVFPHRTVGTALVYGSHSYLAALALLLLASAVSAWAAFHIRDRAQTKEPDVYGSDAAI